MKLDYTLNYTNLTGEIDLSKSNLLEGFCIFVPPRYTFRKLRTCFHGNTWTVSAEGWIENREAGGENWHS